MLVYQRVTSPTPSHDSSHSLSAKGLPNAKGIQTFRVTAWWFEQPTPLKNMNSSVGMMNFPTEWKNKNMFQTTNQH
jgi:hypothetical protein